MILYHSNFKYCLLEKLTKQVDVMSKKPKKGKIQLKNNSDMKNKSSQKKPRYYVFGYLVNDY